MIDWITASKLIPKFFYPFSVVLWLLLFGLIFFLIRRTKITGIFLVIAFAVLVVSGSPLSTELYQQHERQYPASPLDQHPSVSAIVILGGDVALPLAPRTNSEIQGNRVLHAYRLYKARKAQLIIISGGNVFPQGGVQSEAFYTAKVLREWGIPGEVILIEGRSRNTYENALETRKILKDKQIDKILLVTSAFHMPRALATFRTAGIDAVPSPSSYSIADYTRPRILDWVPSVGNLVRMQAVIHENLGILVYRYRGWIG